MLARESVAGALPPGTHGSTFGGNPLACAASLAVLRTIASEGLLEAAASRGAFLSKLLTDLAARHPDLAEGERGLGLLRGLILKPTVDARAALAKARERGVLLTIAGGRVLRFTPPLIVTEAELAEGVARLDAALSALRLELTVPA
jgi:acetylornithine/N-succinyldiaminopimelate aminotransferase